MRSTYRRLEVWNKAVEFCSEIYRITKAFPKEEIYGLTAQLRKAAVSIPSNIAEGQGKSSKGEFILFLGHARGSLFEVETQLEIAARLRYISEADLHSACNDAWEISKMLEALITSLKR